MVSTRLKTLYIELVYDKIELDFDNFRMNS
jgi:hypothetical protein